LKNNTTTNQKGQPRKKRSRQETITDKNCQNYRLLPKEPVQPTPKRLTSDG